MRTATRSGRRFGRRGAKARRRPAARSERAERRLARPRRHLSPRGRRWVLVAAALGALAVAGTYLTVVRELAVFRVEAVEVEGASSGYGKRLSAELAAAARAMTTLHVREDELRRVAGRYPAIVSLEADADLPNRLAIRVLARPPVGLVEGPRGERVPVAADGTLLGGQPLDRPLPRLEGDGGSGRGRANVATIAAARLAAAAPGPLGAWLERVERRRGGWMVKLRRGPQLRFGSLSGLDRKWSAAAAVLAARSARGARFVDVRLPARPSAGGFTVAATPASPARGMAATAGKAGNEPQPTVEGYGGR